MCKHHIRVSCQLQLALSIRQPGWYSDFFKALLLRSSTEIWYFHVEPRIRGSRKQQSCLQLSFSLERMVKECTILSFLIHTPNKHYPKCSAVKRPKYYICLFLHCSALFYVMLRAPFSSVCGLRHRVSEMILQSDKIIDTSFQDKVCLARDFSILSSLLLNNNRQLEIIIIKKSCATCMLLETLFSHFFFSLTFVNVILVFLSGKSKKSQHQQKGSELEMEEKKKRTEMFRNILILIQLE